MRQNKHFENRVVVVTGAASGIGRATALAFARSAASLWVCDLDVAGLQTLASEVRDAGASAVRTQCVDVGSREQMAALCDAVCAVAVPDVLVNNAGVGLAGGLLATSLDDWAWVLHANLWGVIHGCHFFAPKMAERGRGQIVNLASAAGFYNSEAMTAYGTSKFAVVGLSEGLRAELAPSGVGVTAVCPGFINTPIVDSMRLRGESYPESERPNVRRFYERRNYSPERVAEAVLRAARENPALLPVTPEAWALYLLKRAAPDLTRSVLTAAQRLAGRRGGKR